MEKYEGTISAYNKALLGTVFTYTNSFGEEFAQKRFYKKLEEPDVSLRDERKRKAFDSFVDRDMALPQICTPSKEWWKVRDFLHRNLARCRYADVAIPNGSEFNPTEGYNSVEAKLSFSDWTTTEENFAVFSAICYGHLSLKRAVRRRYKVVLRNRGDLYSKYKFREDGTFYKQECIAPHFAKKCREVYTTLRNEGSSNIGLEIFRWKLRQIVTFEGGSRFETVPKNNLVDRPINIECFGNMITQRSIGIHLRKELKRLFKVDLLSLSDKHRDRIRDASVATIDLSNASDNISLDLCKFLLPSNVFKQLAAARSEFILSPKGSILAGQRTWFPLRKISSMGNGFTFELMSLILTCVCRQLDEHATVFGDDIIISNDNAPRLIELLEEVGLVVNKDKSFINSKFRESCGANYHDDEGYIESFDFQYCTNIEDCIVTYNKVKRLAKSYSSFLPLLAELDSHVPKALRGGCDAELLSVNTKKLLSLTGGRGHWLHKLKTAVGLDLSHNMLSDSDDILGSFFKTGGSASPELVVPEAITLMGASVIEWYQHPVKDVKYFQGIVTRPRLRTDCDLDLKASQYGKYAMYLHAGRVQQDIITGVTDYVTCWYISIGGRSIRASSLRYILR